MSNYRSSNPSATTSTSSSSSTAAHEKINIESLVRQARETDQKTIQELAKEVKRLTALLPRKLIDQDEDNLNQTTESTTLSGRGKDKDDVKPMTLAATAGRNASKSKTAPTTSNGSSNGNIENATVVTTTVNTGYNLLHLTVAMIFGAILMLAGVWNKVAA